MKNNNILIVSPQKSGSHLVHNVFKSLEYKLCAETHVEKEFSPNLESHPTSFVEGGNDIRWNLLEKAIFYRFGSPVRRRYGLKVETEILNLFKETNLCSLQLRDFPKDICWLVHQIDMLRCDGDFVNNVLLDDGVKIILNIRDPRDILLSYIGFLKGETKKGLGVFKDYPLYRNIFSGHNTLMETLEFINNDHEFPFKNDMINTIHLAQHKNVLVVKYENLVGVNGGGSDEEQIATVQNILDHTNLNTDASEVAKKLYDTTSFSFNKGKSNHWSKLKGPEKELVEHICNKFTVNLGYK